MKCKNDTMRNGFTLVELLIVIVVIGVLSAMMMLSSTESVSSARASSIISNLRSLKTAALSLYAVSLDKLKDTAPTIGNVWRYMNNDKVDSNYGIAFTVDGSDYENKSWYITCAVSDTGVKTKLQARAETVGLTGSTSLDVAPTGDANYKDTDACVCLKVR